MQVKKIVKKWKVNTNLVVQMFQGHRSKITDTQTHRNLGKTRIRTQYTLEQKKGRHDSQFVDCEVSYVIKFEPTLEQKKQ